jgi:hypothetical protein
MLLQMPIKLRARALCDRDVVDIDCDVISQRLQVVDLLGFRQFGEPWWRSSLYRDRLRTPPYCRSHSRAFHALLDRSCRDDRFFTRLLMSVGSVS